MRATVTVETKCKRIMSAVTIDDIGAPPALARLGLDRVALFLDLDGTLEPFAPTPGEVAADPRRNRLLERLVERLGGRTAVISGRTLADVDRILDRRIVPVAGVHGLQRRSAAGEVTPAWPHPKLGQARAAFHAMAAADRRLLVEDKGLSVALHYRGSPGCAEAVRDLARRLSEAIGLVLQEGVMVAELRTPGPGKGEALEAFMAEPPFAGAVPVCLGDDLTDEDGFEAAAAAGGHGILVGPARETAAHWRLSGVEAALAWLAGGLGP